MSQLRQAGYYNGDIVAAVFSQSQGGTDQMVIDFALYESQGTARVYLFTTERAWDYTKEKLQKLGFNGNFDNPEFTNGTDVQLSMKVEHYDGKDREKWDISGGLPQKAAPDRVRTMQAKWRAEVGGGRPAAAPARTASTTAAAPSRPATTTAAPSRPAPSRPAPKQEPKFDKQAAWEQLQQGFTANGKVLDETAFFAAIDKVIENTKVAEADFTDEHWKMVADFDDIPF